MDESRQSYVAIVHRNVDVWLKRTENLNDSQIGKLNKKFPNLLRIIEQALSHPETQTEKVALLVKQSYLLVARYGRWLIWVPIIRNCSSIYNDKYHEDYIELLIQLGKCFNRTGQLEKAIEIHEEAKAWSKKPLNIPLYLESLFNLCFNNRSIRHYEAAKQLGEEALNTAIEYCQQNDLLIPTILNEVGRIYLDLGNEDNLLIAEKKFKEALYYLNMETSESLFCKITINLGQTLRNQNNLEEALNTLQKANSLIDATSNEIDKSKLWNSYGITYYQMGRWHEAEVAFNLANSEIIRISGDFFAQASINQNLGNVMIKQNRFVEAESFLWSAIRFWEQVNNQVWLANSYGSMGELMGMQARNNEAGNYYDNAISILKREKPTVVSQRILGKFLEEKNNLTKGLHS